MSGKELYDRIIKDEGISDEYLKDLVKYIADKLSLKVDEVFQKSDNELIYLFGKVYQQ